MPSLTAQVPGPPADDPTTTPGAEPAGPRSRALTPLLTALLLALATLALYSPVFDHAFLNWDDPQYVRENALTLGKHYGALMRAVVSHHYHPLTMWSLAWNVGSPLSPRPFLVTNVALHMLNTMLVFWLVYRISGQRLPVAALVALLFGVHPMHVESVAWIAERKDVLYACFYLGGLIAYWEYLERSSRPLLALAFVLFVLSCLAKGMAVTFPLAMLLLDLWRGRPLREPGVILEKLPFLLVSLLFGAIVMDVQGGGDFHGLLHGPARVAPGVGEPATFDLARRIATPAFGIMMYVWRLFVPVRLCALYPYPFVGDRGSPALFLAPLAVLALVGLVIWDLRRTRIIAFGVGWYLATVALTLQWVPVGPGITKSIPVGWAFIPDRYTYLPYLGLCFIMAMGLDAAFRYRRSVGLALWGACAVFTAFLIVQTRHQIATWKTSEALWSRTIQVHPGLALAYVYRGKDRDASGRAAEAQRDFRAAFDLGLRTADVYEGLGSTSASLGMLDSAAVQFDRAVRADPARGRSYYNRAIVRVELGRLPEAVADLDTALARLPAEAPMIHGVRGYALLKLGDCRAAVADFDRALAGGVRDPGVQYGRGSCRLELGDIEGAARDFEETLRLDPGYDKARARLREMGR
jgi:Flp pilus assembly protein TadD